ncbi:MAG: ATP-binding cassette domain-containing protein [Prevotellaceae bacterium]|jgi:molybdate transport system ATP-binding protein|nr:ATP-binding cassette domain-containing protein [Prevotellaceae bacterium]
MTNKVLIAIENATFRKGGQTVFPDTDFELQAGENIAVTGANGAGKTTFLELLQGQLVTVQGEMRYTLDQQQIAAVYFSDPTLRYENFYYQQRYNSSETEGIITVRDFTEYGEITNCETGDTALFDALGIDRLLDMEIIKLSNGQFKKMLIAKALTKKTSLLLLDNLYTGLDRQSRKYLSETIETIASSGTSIVMTSEMGDVPEIINRVLAIENCRIGNICSRTDFYPTQSPVAQHNLPPMPCPPEKTFEIAVHFDNVSIAYYGKTIVKEINLTVRHGEKWILAGPNGSGKTMLLSLIFADNPQAYSNNIILFDRKRGTGESIWDIKDKTGFVSPEMHLYQRRNKTCREVIMNVLNENPYNRIAPTDSILHFIDNLFNYFRLANIADQPFAQVSTGQQSVVILIRALAKNAPMLILDEPFQGMDAGTVAAAKLLLEHYCHNRTLIFVSHIPEEIPEGITDFKWLNLNT